MNTKPDHEVIFLVSDDGESWSWCEDPAPSSEMEESDSIKYVRADRIEELEALVPKWISVGDQKPVGKCLVYDGVEMHTAEYHKNIVVIGGHFEFDREPVTHWMTLPAHPSN